MAAPSNPINDDEQSILAPGTFWRVRSTYVVGTESDRLFIVWLEIEDTSAVVTSVIWDVGGANEGFTEVIAVSEGISRGSLWALVNPAAATSTLDVNYDTGPSETKTNFWYHSGAKQVIPSEGEASNSDPGASEIAISVDITTSGPDRMIVAGVGLGDANEVTQGSGESLIHSTPANSSTAGSSFFVQASSGTRAMDFTFSASRRPHIVGVAIEGIPTIHLTMPPYIPA